MPAAVTTISQASVHPVQRLVPTRRPRRRHRNSAEVGPRFRRDRRGLSAAASFALRGLLFCERDPHAFGAIDGGVGYVLNPWLRTDATLEYRFGGRLRSTTAIDDPALLGAEPFRSADRLRAGVSSLVALINFTVDLGNYWGTTPFVGAGIGVADNALSGVSDQGFAIAGSGATVPVGGFFSNASRTSFAWR